MINKTNEKIRYVAFKLFLENGYEATNIRDICKEVEIKASSLYFYYTSKHELFFSIYENIWSKKISYIQSIEELKQNISPNMKLYEYYKRIMSYYTENILQHKFLLRYHLFPSVELSIPIREKFKFWTNEENKLILDLINQCLDARILQADRRPNDYLQEYKKFENDQINEMIISNIKIKDKELDRLWSKFWYCTMLLKCR